MLPPGPVEHHNAEKHCTSYLSKMPQTDALPPKEGGRSQISVPGL
jgi:hypothetical protein